MAIRVSSAFSSSLRHARGLKAFFAKANLRHADTQHLRLGTKLWHATEALKDEKAVELLSRSDVVKKLPQSFVSRNMEVTGIGPKFQRHRVALRIQDLRKKIGSKNARTALKKVAIDFKKRGEYRGLNAADVRDLTTIKRRK